MRTVFPAASTIRSAGCPKVTSTACWAPYRRSLGAKVLILSSKRPPRKCWCAAVASLKPLATSRQSEHVEADSDIKSVGSIVAYAQSHVSIQNVANDNAPLRVFLSDSEGYVGGFSPGRTFGPVVATVGVGVADLLEGGAGLVTGDVELGGTVECGADVLPPDPLVHATAPSKIRAIGAIPLLRTA